MSVEHAAMEGRLVPGQASPLSILSFLFYSLLSCPLPSCPTLLHLDQQEPNVVKEKYWKL